jgi:hypothetical protein
VSPVKRWARGIVLFEMLVAIGLVLLGVTGESVSISEPWLADSPTHIQTHYSAWQKTGRDWAHPAWHRFWLKRNPPDAKGPVIVDRRHSRKQPLNAVIGPNEYRYNHMHGMGFLGAELQRRGVVFDRAKGSLTAKRLGGASMVFINLPSGDGPGFSHAEVLSLNAFVRAGGGLVLLTDHTNAYFHGEMLAPLAQALGFEIPPVTACDKAPGFTMSPRTTTWIVPRVQGEHPILRGVQRLALMTAGALFPAPESELSVLATTSPKGWQDFWNPYKKPNSAGLTGNMAQDIDEPDEAVSVLIAGQVGQGRVVVLSDQNAWGSIMLGVEDNLQLALNAFSWAKGHKKTWTIDPPVVEFVSGDFYACGTAARGGFHSFFVNAARQAAARKNRVGASVSAWPRHTCRATPSPTAESRIWLPRTKPMPTDLQSSPRTVLLGPPLPALQSFLDRQERIRTTAFLNLWILDSGEQVLLLKQPEWITNLFLGRERVNPARADAKTQAAHQLANAVLAWAYGTP